MLDQHVNRLEIDCFNAMPRRSSDADDVFVESEGQLDDENIVDESMVIDRTSDMTQARESISDQKQSPLIQENQISAEMKPVQLTDSLKMFRWIPESDNPNFEEDFIDQLYKFMTKDTLTYWALERLPDAKAPLASSTRSKTASQDDEWKRSPENLVQNSRVSIGYAEATKPSVDKILSRFIDYGLNDKSIFLDLGSGFGKVVFHIATMT